ncbi:nucleotidyltransferase family protein [Nitratireductor basaltis]|uniref:Nucleotidyl transferase n=1 Tax=Nitratireductor basaltis TaxID=472175 RepID=A0A084U692_9HYPH|nr:nucleotidyltransferase family protein [Nitratireductor basaltis]KFB08478.1 Nucleotidyl transferase [Nitratireductor basaltis]
MTDVPQKAMVLSAGLGMRMRPLTETTPKPLIKVGGKPLIDWGLDTLQAAGVSHTVVNVHHLAEQMEAHLAQRRKPSVTISDEREILLDSAGGLVKALPELGSDPCFILNADTFWLDDNGLNLRRLAEAWDPAHMDMLLLLVAPENATGHSGKIDFLMNETAGEAAGAIRRAQGSAEGYIYAGSGIVNPAVFSDASAKPHSLNIYFDRAIEAGRLYGLPLQGHWITVGTPDAIAPAEQAIRQLRGS